MEEKATEMSPNEVLHYINENKPCILIDVREDIEVAQGMIEQAKHIPLQSLPSCLDELDQSKEIICICRSGQRSNSAALYLEKQGYTSYNMAGGMLDWEGEVFIK